MIQRFCNTDKFIPNQAIIRELSRRRGTMTSKFWKLLKMILPDWQERKIKLEKFLI